MMELARHAHCEALSTLDRPGRRGARGRVPHGGRRLAPLSTGRGRHGGGLRPDRSARSPVGRGPHPPRRPTPEADDAPARRGLRRDGRARAGRPGGPAHRQLHGRDRRPRDPRLRRLEPGVRRGAERRGGRRTRPRAGDPGHRPPGLGPRRAVGPDGPPRRRRRAHAGLSPRLRPPDLDRRPELLPRPLPRELPARAGAEPHVPARGRGPRAPAGGHRVEDDRGRPPDLRPRRGDRQPAPLPRRMRAAQGPRHGRRPLAPVEGPLRPRRRAPLGPPAQRRAGPPAAPGRRAQAGASARARATPRWRSRRS